VGEADGIGDGVELVATGTGAALCVAFTVVAVADEPCANSKKTTIATPATPATTMAPTTAIAERKLVSSIQVLNATRMRLPRFTTQHDTGANGYICRNRALSRYQ
jgi:hypothetical protein